MARIAPWGGQYRPLLARRTAKGGGDDARSKAFVAAVILSMAAVACAAALALSTFGKIGVQQAQTPMALVERRADLGEDWFSAVEAPHKTYEWPWLKDGKFYHQSKVLAYGPEENWDEMTGWRAYRRNPFDENGDRGYDVDQRPADDCYAKGGDDCFRSIFDPETGFLPA